MLRNSLIKDARRIVGLHHHTWANALYRLFRDLNNWKLAQHCWLPDEYIEVTEDALGCYIMGGEL